MLDRRTTMMAFIQCTDLHAATGHANFLYVYKKILSIKLIQILLDSIDSFIIAIQILAKKKFIQV